MPDHPLHDPVISWYERNARDLPWRTPLTGKGIEGQSPRPDAWGVLVSEFMLQQTPVERVLPIWREWMTRWPTPADLAATPSGEAIRAWGRLGYPRRALRLHASAVAITEKYHGRVPTSVEELRALPGVGEYTAAAVASFAFRQRHAVLDTNVRRVHARAVSAVAQAAPSVNASERKLAEALLPHDPERAATWAVATMELGALICTARTPDCLHCPILSRCAWQRRGAPPAQGPPRRSQGYAGTDRQVRGLLLGALRASPSPLGHADLRKAAPDDVLRDPAQRERCLDSLVADGLVEPLARKRFRLPQ